MTFQIMQCGLRNVLKLPQQPDENSCVNRPTIWQIATNSMDVPPQCSGCDYFSTYSDRYGTKLRFSWSVHHYSVAKRPPQTFCQLVDVICGKIHRRAKFLQSIHFYILSVLAKKQAFHNSRYIHFLLLSWSNGIAVHWHFGIMLPVLNSMHE